jgi:predicted Rossmann fold nucleotide-binding protein DprA/Smf involved in DNA uptake
MAGEVIHIPRNDRRYPASLVKHLGDKAPLSIATIGNTDILDSRSLAIFSSAKCPGSIILKTYDLMKKLRESEVAVISGFHSPMERECLNIPSKGKQPIIVCPDRSIEGMRIKPQLRQLLDDGRLLILSPFDEKDSRMSSARAWERNRFVAALASEIFIAYAAQGSRTEKLCTNLISKGRPLYTMADERNENLLRLGARAMDAADPRLL